MKVRIEKFMPMVNFFLLLTLFCFENVWGTSIYVYVDQDGNKMFSDLPLEDNSNFRLINLYSADDKYGLTDELVNTDTSSLFLPVSSRYDNLIVSVAEQTDMDPALIKAMIHVESAFNPDAVSSKGAMGLMQLMPDTARRYGVKFISNPMDNVHGGSRHMNYLLDLFDENLELALAAYNAGEHTVSRFDGIPPYPETINYVKKVKKLYETYKQNMRGG